MDLRTFQLLNRVLDVIEKVALSGAASEGSGDVSLGTAPPDPKGQEDDKFLSDSFEANLSKAVNSFLAATPPSEAPQIDDDEGLLE